MKKKKLSPAEMKTLSYEVKKMNAIMAAIEKYDFESKFKKVIITDMGTFNAAKNKWQKRKREIEKICAESDELKELQQKIKLAYLNKERSAQITEN